MWFQRSEWAVPFGALWLQMPIEALDRWGADMSTSYIAPLCADVWFARIEKLARGELHSLECSLRHLFHLMQLTPPQFRHLVRSELDEGRFEVLLDAGELDLAASSLLAQPLRLTIAPHGANGLITAKVRCPNCSTVFSGIGKCTASASLASWLSCLLSLPREPNVPCDPATHLSRPEAQHEPRQRSMLH